MHFTHPQNPWPTWAVAMMEIAWKNVAVMMAQSAVMVDSAGKNVVLCDVMMGALTTAVTMVGNAAVVTAVPLLRPWM
jgi:hypothetical protein